MRINDNITNMTYFLKDDDNPFLNPGDSTPSNARMKPTINAINNNNTDDSHADNNANIKQQAVTEQQKTIPELRIPVRINKPKIAIKRAKPHANKAADITDSNSIEVNNDTHVNHDDKTTVTRVKVVNKIHNDDSNHAPHSAHIMKLDANQQPVDDSHEDITANNYKSISRSIHDENTTVKNEDATDSHSANDDAGINKNDAVKPAGIHHYDASNANSASTEASVNAQSVNEPEITNASSDVLIYDDSGTIGNQLKHKAGRVILIIMLIVFIIGCMFTSFKIGGFTRDKYYHDNPVIQKVTDTIINPTPMDRETMQSLVKTLQSLDGSKTDNVHIAAIAGVIYGESKGDSTALERTDGSKPENCEVDDTTGSSRNCGNDVIMKWVQSGTHGIGILQWTGDRAVKYLNYANSNGSKWDDLNTQVNYLLIELNDVNQWREPLDDNGNVGINGQAGLDRFNNANDVSTASKSLLLGFVRPAKPNDSYWMRLRAALDAYNWIQINEAGVSWDDAFKKEHLW